ncbi:MAG: hypothetical protein KDB02_11585 [Acidimicrobiales bacterium]|nr:hypothetical protein [Acidimicrobiales bacterium]
MGALLLAVAFVAVLLLRAGGDPSILVHAGPPWTHADEAPASLTVQAADQAYDGQFFYRLGVSPWSTERIVGGVENDLPSLRNARWGFGALAWVASGGDADLVPWALIALNLGAAFAVGALGGALARTSGRHTAWGLLFFLWPGFAYSLSLDTSELVASAFVLAGLLAARKRQGLGAAAALTAAVLTRDTTAVVPFGFAIAGAWSMFGRAAVERAGSDVGRSPGREPGPMSGVRALATGAVPLAVFVIWQLVQRSRFGSLPLTSSGDNNLSGPLVGFVQEVGKLVPPGSGEEGFRLLFALGLVGVLVLGAWCFRRSQVPPPERVAWVAAAGVVVLLSEVLWAGATAFMRAGTELGLMTTVVLLGTEIRLPRRLLAVGFTAGWLLTAVAQVTKIA